MSRHRSTSQGYKLGWIFAGLEGGLALLTIRGVIEGPPNFSEGINLVLSPTLCFTAVVRTPWSWRALVGGLLLHVVIGSWNTFSALAFFPLPGFSLVTSAAYVAASAAFASWHGVWLGYFYRRRVMFGAEREWWLEKFFPWLTASQGSVKARWWPRPSGPRLEQVPFRGVFGLSRGGSLFLAFMLVALLLVLYQWLFPQ